MKRAIGTFDFVLDTIPVVHELDPYLRSSAPTAHWCWSASSTRFRRSAAASSSADARHCRARRSAAFAETQELLDFCAAKGIVADCEMTTMPQINEAFERMEKGDVRYRFVVDMQTL